MTITDVKQNLSDMLHGGSLNKVRNIDLLLERAGNVLLTKIDPIDTMRTAALSSTIYDDIYNYALPSDFKKIIDLYPQADRNTKDTANRFYTEKFDLKKALTTKMVAIEGSEGSKILRVNWRKRAPVVLHTMNGYDDNGTWAAVGSASGIVTDDIDYVSGSGSVRVDLSTTGDGLYNNSMSVTNLTDEDEVGDFFVWFKIKNAADLANLNSVSLRWGNDETTNYWLGVAQTTQVDGTAFKVGWNQVKVPWSTATEYGTVNPATIDTLMITFSIDAAISDVRVDNITCGIGSNFDIKYYSKYLLKNTSGTWISRTTSDDDVVVLDNDAIQIYLLECLATGAHQIEAADSTFDINFSNMQLETLYTKYKNEHPSEAKKQITSYGSLPARGRW
jgi:hypothetical protein